uniref:F-box domain-containing protein n=1 Tax=Caenorhabditis tropicalis TaxID=1561998 RepID=A0A1I7UPA6_9PELO
MKEHFLTNQNHLLIAARYEFLRGFPITKAYKNFCEALGDDAMSYKDFDFWCFRFSNGNFGFNADPPKTAELFDIPDFVLQKIAEKCDVDARCALWNSSNKCRRIVKKVRVVSHCQIIIKANSTKLTIDGNTFNYNDPEGRYDVTDALKKLLPALKDPSNHFKKLSIQIETALSLSPMTSGLEAKLANVESLELEFITRWFRYGDEETRETNIIKRFIENFAPGSLQNIHLNFPNTRHSLPHFSHFAGLEQWKQAKRLETNMPCSIESVLHFVSLEVKLIDNNIKTKEAINLKNYYMNMPNFEFCRMRTSLWDRKVRTIRRAMKVKKFPVVDGSIEINITPSSLGFKKIL